MQQLEYKPQIFRIVTESSNGPNTWDMLTVDGETPDSTIYFMEEGSAPSHLSQEKIVESIEKEDWEVLEIGYEGLEVSDFDISIKDFELAGSGYAKIVEALKKELENKNAED